ncbi:hypothetical protein IPL68_03565 [Candidatus Saccharibacteria bacterium]|nr:MAG: hypothetical protein IPL68_03565 [Candidatus Saccharibacteria bacterium]
MLADDTQLAALVDLFHTGSKQEYSKGNFWFGQADHRLGSFILKAAW